MDVQKERSSGTDSLQADAQVKVGVIDVGLGNTGSILNMLERLGASGRLVSSRQDIRDSEMLILPGVGHFDKAMSALHREDIVDTLVACVLQHRVPILGICLGMQLLCRNSEEGDISGLGLIDADVERFRSTSASNLKIPHMGWNTVDVARSNALLPADDEEQRFYFVHSYKVVPDDPAIIIGSADYGGVFCAAYQNNNIFGVQFHPEKSHRFGLNLMRRFLEC